MDSNFGEDVLSDNWTKLNPPASMKKIKIKLLHLMLLVNDQVNALNISEHPLPLEKYNFKYYA